MSELSYDEWMSESDSVLWHIERDPLLRSTITSVWFLDSVPGAMARLGTRTSGGATYDLHQGNLRIDVAATPIAARVLAEAAVTALSAAG